jgi:hypothetical protein
MSAPYQSAFHDGGTPDSGAQGNHHDVIAAARCTRMPFTQEGHSRVVFEDQWQSELLTRPGSNVNRCSIGILMIRGNDAPGCRIHQATKTEAYPHKVAAMPFCELHQCLSQDWKKILEAAFAIRLY